LELDRSFVLI